MFLETIFRIQFTLANLTGEEIQPRKNVQMNDNLTPVKTIRDQIAGSLRADILSGKIPRGTKLREQGARRAIWA